MKSLIIAFVLFISCGECGCVGKNKNESDKNYQLATFYTEQSTFYIGKDNKKADSLYTIAMSYKIIADSLYLDYLKTK